MRKRSKSKILRDRADRCVQDWFRKKYPKRKCESCGVRTFYCVHHHIEKSKSNFLRFCHPNLVFLCKSCHDALHFGDHQVVARYTARRGEDWVKEIEGLRKERRASFSQKELEEIIKVYG